MSEATKEDRPELNVSVEDSGPARKMLKIVIPESRIKTKIEETFGTLQEDAQIPGFRRGRAPRRLLQKRFGDSIRDDAKGQLLSEAYSQAIEEKELDVIGEPDVKNADKIELPESGDLTLEVEVEITPEVDLPEFKDIKVTKVAAEVTDEDVEEEINRYRERFGKAAAIADAKIEAGDFLKADAHIYPQDKKGDADAVIVHLHDTYIMVNGENAEFKGHVAGIVVEDLGKKLAGKKVGDELSIEMDGPASHENDDIKDKPIAIEIKINAIERLEPAPIEEVIKNVGMETEADFRDKLKEMLVAQKDREQKSDMYTQVNDQLIEKVALELPEGLTGRQIERVLQRQRMEALYRGTSENEIADQLAESRNESEEAAKKQLKLFFIIDKASRELDVDVNENEINGQIAMYAMQQGRRPEKLRQEMQKRGEIEQLYLQIREQKTLDKILEVAEIEEVAAKEKEAKPAAKKKASKKKASKKKASKKKAAAKKKDDE
ncbi:Trigger factor [Poriferisphaera corsica]|uniref:Trigger factor n=1 Tax=Poriferisphaera corsica TaxID=2528020 RepID=A0A517YUD9_9BACT|nr:trigger factor [Poriferisphaera corsica]QDU33850.1 Trigger factor [Poriferisphaera corsica]